MSFTDSGSQSEWSDEEMYLHGDPEWEFSRAAKNWEIRRIKWVEEKIKAQHEEEALESVRFLFEEEEERRFQDEVGRMSEKVNNLQGLYQDLKEKYKQ